MDECLLELVQHDYCGYGAGQLLGGHEHVGEDRVDRLSRSTSRDEDAMRCPKPRYHPGRQEGRFPDSAGAVEKHYVRAVYSRDPFVNLPNFCVAAEIDFRVFGAIPLQIAKWLGWERTTGQSGEAAHGVQRRQVRAALLLKGFRRQGPRVYRPG